MVRASLALSLVLALSPGTTSLQAQSKKGKPQPSAGARVAYFSTTGDLSESLPNGIGFQAYYDHPLAAFFSKLPSYAPQSIQAVLNYESLSNSETEADTQLEARYRPLETSNSLSRV